MNARARILAFSTASGRVGRVLLEAGKVIDIGMSRKAGRSPVEARGFAAQQIEALRPDVVVTEKILGSSRKSQKTRAVTKAIAEVADLADVQSIKVVRVRAFTNRFEEAADLAARYPELRPYLPKARKPWDSEPKPLNYFEAVVLVETAFGTPSAAEDQST